MSNIVEETNFLMKKYNIKANKLLGQNFLIDDKVINQIVEGSRITSEDLVIEIGPGLGTLTKYLVERARKVICIELDNKMVEILLDRFKLYDNIEIIHEDILKANLKQMIYNQKEKYNIKSVKVVANLPYYITTPIIMKLLEEELDLESITVMIQKEVADRLIAQPGEKNTGAITYSVFYYSVGEKIAEVSRSSFIPEPEVTSEVIKLKIRKMPPVNVKNKELLFKIIKSAFQQRRKTLLNSLCNSNIFTGKDEGTKILNEVGLEQNIRAEKLTLQQFANITDKIN